MIKTFKEPNLADGTCYLASIEISYREIEDMFGDPTGGDGYKTTAEWIIGTPFGIGTIYDYKICKEYQGNSGVDCEDNIYWSVGGHNIETAEHIAKLLNTNIITK